jgi:cholesterol transport system auxiliary component
MMRQLRLAISLSSAALLAGCSLGGLLGGGGKPPPVLYTLSATAPPATNAAQQASAANAVTIRVPIVEKELRTTRVPVEISPTQVQYVTGLDWVDTPDRLFQSLVSETVRRTTGRLVLDPDQSSVDPGIVVSGTLNRFGYDAQRGVVVVRYDATINTTAGLRSQSFTAEAPADGTAASVAPALNQAANQVAQQVANWIG